MQCFDINVVLMIPVAGRRPEIVVIDRDDLLELARRKAAAPEDKRGEPEFIRFEIL